MIDPAVFINAPLLFDKELYIYPPSVREVITNPNFNIYYKVLTLTQEEIQDELRDKVSADQKFPTQFEYLIIHCCYTDGFLNIVKEAFKLFCKSEISFSQEGNIEILQNEEKPFVLSEENYFNFQNTIRTAVGDKNVAEPEPFDPNEDPRIRKIKERARERDRIKARQNSKNGISLSTCLVAICCMGIGLTPLNIGEMSYANVGEIMKMMQDKEKYDIDIRSLLAGADSKKVKPKYWIRNSDKE